MVTKTKEDKNSPKPERFYRSEKDRVIGGVCGGIAYFFSVDPSLIRLIFILVTIFGGSGILLYLILWIIIPSESSVTPISQSSMRENVDEIKEKAQKFAEDIKVSSQKGGSKKLFGYILLGLGVLFLLGNFGFFHIFNLERLWPLILIALAFGILFKNGK